MLLSALAGGASPHSSASRWSVETIAFGCCSRIANSERCLIPPSAIARPPSLTSRGPSTRKSIGGLRPTVPFPHTRRQRQGTGRPALTEFARTRSKRPDATKAPETTLRRDGPLLARLQRLFPEDE